MSSTAQSRLVGRKAELLALDAAFRAGERLVTLTGPPGVGKTRVALEYVEARPHRAVREEPPERVVRCSLAEASSEADLGGAVAGALGVSLRGGPTLDRLAHALAGHGPLLLLLDDGDRLGGVLGPSLDRWLRRAPELRVLATSRRRVGSSGEHVIEVSPLALAAAVEMFVARAGQAAGGRGATDPETVAKLCERLDRLPLSIGLAAARSRILPPRKLLERIDQKLRILRGADVGRHASLLAAIGVSWELLAASDRSALAQCAAFVGAFSLEAAEAAIRIEGDGEPGAIDALEALCEMSLVARLDEADAPDEVRFRMYESVRAVALQKLEAFGARASVEARIDIYTVEEASQLAAALEGPDPAAAARRLELGRDNLVAVHRRTLSRAPALAARAGLALSALLVLRGAAEIGVIEATVVAARRAGDTALLVRALTAFSLWAARAGRVDEPRAALEEAVELARSQDDAALLGRALVARGRLRMEQGDLPGAGADLDEGLARVTSSADPHLEGNALNEIGRLHEMRGGLTDAARSFERARGRFRRSGGVRMEAICLVNLGVVRYAEGRLEDARALLEEALEGHRRAEDRATEADNRLNLGSVHLSAGRLDEAERQLSTALVQERELGNRRFEGLALGNLAMVAHEQGALRTARDRYQQALATFRECEDRRFHGIFLPFFAAVEASLGLIGEARADFVAARAYLEELGDPGLCAVLDALEGFLDLARTRAAGVGREEVVAAARARLARAEALLERSPAAARASELTIAVRLLARAIEPVGREGRPSPAPGAPAPAEALVIALVIGPEARWFRPAGGDAVDVSRRGALRLILAALVEQRLAAPGVGVAQARLFELGWPGQRAQPKASASRVYTAIRTLRRLGLSGVLILQDDGYALEPTVPVVRG